MRNISKKNNDRQPFSRACKTEGQGTWWQSQAMVSDPIGGAPNFSVFAVDQAGGGGGAAPTYLFGHN